MTDGPSEREAAGDSPTESVFGRSPRLLWAVLVLLFTVAGALRLVELDAVGVLVDRDFTSAMFARAFYFESGADVEPWRREMARATLDNQPRLEPPVTEWLASLAYRLADREDVRLARLITIFFWLVGGWFLYLTVRRLVSLDGAVFALTFYLLVPHGVLLSRSFQPDALMMLGFLASLYLTVRYHEGPSAKRLMLAGAVAGGTLAYRPLVLPALVGAFVAPVLARRGLLGAARDRATLAYLGISCVPALLFYGYATFVARSFGWKLTTSFMPHQLLHMEYWRGWGEIVLSVIGAVPLAIAGVGLVLLRPGLARATVIGMGLGYVVFGLVFTSHIHTHGYYSAQLIPMVAVAGAPLVAISAQRFVAAPGRLLKVCSVALIGAVSAVSVFLQVNAGLHRAGFLPPPVAREIGDLVEHSTRVAFLSRYYGLPLQYLGEFTGAYWPRASTYWLYRPPGERPGSVAERYADLGFRPDYFVITHFPEYQANHQDLASYLESRCLLKASSGAYRIYERCAPPEG